MYGEGATPIRKPYFRPCPEVESTDEKDPKQLIMTIKDYVRIAPYDGIGPSKEWQKE